MKSLKGFTLTETLVGTALMLIVFLGIFGAYQLSLKVIGLSKAKIIATAIANGQIEKIRNLTFGSIGVQGGFPEGVLEVTTTTIQNNIQYTIETRVDYMVDLADGEVPPQDECPNDYKKVQVKVSWPGRFGGQVILVTDIAPKNLAEECSTGGGILSVSVFDAYGIMVPSSLIEIKDPATDETLKTATPFEGRYYFSLAASTYKVVVSKDGYSTERTYGTDEITTPDSPHPTILEGKSTPISFSIDKLSNFSIDTLSPGGEGYFFDSFSDETKISESSNIFISDGHVNLIETEGVYSLSGYLISTAITPESLIKWKEFSFNDSMPSDTQIFYQFLYFDGENWVLIPDADLPGNSDGFGDSPVDLSALNIVNYSQLKLKGNLSTQSSILSPALYDWQISWTEAVLIPNTTFHLQGKKNIGSDEEESPVYKYSQDKTSNSSGHIDLSNLEWDLYTFSVAPASGLDLINIQPSPQPINLPPDAATSVKLYLDAQNSFLLTVRDINNLEPIFSATVRIYNTGLGYDQTQYTNAKGQTYFIPLDNATYNLEISSLDYLPVSTTVSISGDKTETIKLEPEE